MISEETRSTRKVSLDNLKRDLAQSIITRMKNDPIFLGIYGRVGYVIESYRPTLNLNFTAGMIENVSKNFRFVIYVSLLYLKSSIHIRKKSF